METFETRSDTKSEKRIDPRTESIIQEKVEDELIKFKLRIDEMVEARFFFFDTKIRETIR